MPRANNDNQPARWRDMDRLDWIVWGAMTAAKVSIPLGIFGAWWFKDWWPLIATAAGLIFFMGGG